MTIDAFNGEFYWLSNFYYSPVVFDGDTYPTAEHAYQAAKAEYPSDRILIRNAQTAGIAKRLGRRITLRADWEEIKLRTMDHVLRAKFSDPALRAKLLSTHPRELIEGNTWGDRFWGVCKGVGENHLGKTLMRIREDLLHG